MRKRTVLLTGAGGQLGSALQSITPSDWEIVPFDSSALDIRNWHAVRDTFARVQPDLVLHAAAATNVDRCEREPAWAFEINALGTRHIAQAASFTDAALVYVSTNYVFDGEKPEPYHEFDRPHPISVYGASKLAGEQEALQAVQGCWVVRTASVYAERGTNFVATMRRLMNEHPRITVVDDQYSNPTYATDLANTIVNIVERAPFGTYHVTNAGSTSWHGWAEEIRKLTGAECEVAAIPASEYQRAAQPPANGNLESLALPAHGITLPDWRNALKRCLDQWPA